MHGVTTYGEGPRLCNKIPQKSDPCNDLSGPAHLNSALLLQAVNDLADAGNPHEWGCYGRTFRSCSPIYGGSSKGSQVVYGLMQSSRNDGNKDDAPAL
jgi:hypothetical protein